MNVVDEVRQTIATGELFRREALKEIEREIEEGKRVPFNDRIIQFHYPQLKEGSSGRNYSARRFGGLDTEEFNIETESGTDPRHPNNVKGEIPGAFWDKDSSYRMTNLFNEEDGLQEPGNLYGDYDVKLELLICGEHRKERIALCSLKSGFPAKKKKLTTAGTLIPRLREFATVFAHNPDLCQTIYPLNGHDYLLSSRKDIDLAIAQSELTLGNLEQVKKGILLIAQNKGFEMPNLPIDIEGLLQ